MLWEMFPMHFLVPSLLILIAVVPLLLMHTGKQNFCRQKSRFSLLYQLKSGVVSLTHQHFLRLALQKWRTESRPPIRGLF